MRCYYLCLCLIIAITGLYAQHPGWTNYTYGKSVRSICSDAEYTWVATEGGLARINRTTLETAFFNRANSGLPVNALDQVAKDSLNNLWVLHGYPNGLSRFNGTEWVSYEYTGGGGNFTNFAVRGPNDIWIGTESAGLFHFDGSAFTQYSVCGTPLSNPTVEAVSCDSLGRVWFGTVFYVGESRILPTLVCYDGTDFTVVDVGGLENYSYIVKHITFDSQNVLWVGTQSDGLWSYDGYTWTHYTPENNGLSTDSVTALCLDPLGRIWVGTSLGVDCFDGINWQHFDQNNTALISGLVNDINFDSDGVGWFASYHTLSRWQNGTWQVIPTSNSGYSYSYILNQIQDSNDKHWFANWGGLDWFDEQVWGHVDLPGDNDLLRDLEYDSRGRLWLATQFQGLLCYEEGVISSFTPSNSELPNVYVHRLAIDSLDRVWMGFPYEGVACLSGTTMMVYNEYNSPLPSGRVTALEVDNQNRVWVGLTDGGSTSWLAKLEGNVWSIYNSVNSGLPGYYIFSIEAKDGLVWIGTNQGLARFDETNWEVWNQSNSGLPSNVVYAIAFDRNGHLFAGTSQGLAHFANGDWTVWDASNSGIADNGCTYLYVATNNNIWVGNYRNGVSVYEHEVSGTDDPCAVPVAQNLKVSPNPFTNEVRISGLDVHQKREVSLFNLRGQKLANWTFTAGQDARLNLTTKDLNRLPAGVYLLQAKSGNELRRGKAVKVH